MLVGVICVKHISKPDHLKGDKEEKLLYFKLYTLAQTFFKRDCVLKIHHNHAVPLVVVAGVALFYLHVMMPE